MVVPLARRFAARLLLLALCALLPLGVAPAQAAQTAQPTNVSIPGSFNSKIGCSADWAPDCEKAQLSYDATNDPGPASGPCPPGTTSTRRPLTRAGTRAMASMRPKAARTSPCNWTARRS